MFFTEERKAYGEFRQFEEFKRYEAFERFKELSEKHAKEGEQRNDTAIPMNPEQRDAAIPVNPDQRPPLRGQVKISGYTVVLDVMRGVGPSTKPLVMELQIDKSAADLKGAKIVITKVEAAKLP